MFGKWKPFNPEQRGVTLFFILFAYEVQCKHLREKDGTNGMVLAILYSIRMGRITMQWPGHTE